MKKLIFLFLLSINTQIFAENIKDLPFKKIVKIFDKSCHQGNMIACESLSDLYRNGNTILNITTNDKKEKQYNSFLCKNAGNHCHNDLQYISDNYQEFCHNKNANEKLGVFMYCSKVFNEQYQDNPQSEISQYVENQCKNNQFWACRALQNYYRNNKNKEKYQEYLTLSTNVAYQQCDTENIPLVCEYAMILSKQNKDTQKEEFYSKKVFGEIYKNQCDNNLLGNGDFSSCYLYYQYNNDIKNRTKYAQKGCELGDDKLCNYLATFYTRKPFINPKEEKQSKEYFGKACNLGNLQSCVIYQNFDIILIYKKLNAMNIKY